MSGHDTGFSADGTSMEQVRDLLFGTQFKEMEIRLQRQEERFQREVADAKDALKNRLDSLENFMKSETASLLGRLNAEKAERDSMFKDSKREFDEALKLEQRERSESVRSEQRERSEALAQAAKDLAAGVDMLERKLAGLSHTLDSTERELRQLLLTESGSLSAKIEEKYQQALDTMRRTSDQIRHDMVYRSALSNLFTETAVKLSGQWSSDFADVRSGKPAAEPAASGKAARQAKEAAEGANG